MHGLAILHRILSTRLPEIHTKRCARQLQQPMQMVWHQPQKQASYTNPLLRKPAMFESPV